jgi:hypothetical protein
MNIEIRLPNINAPTSEGKLQQIQSYMHQLVGQLNWALNNLDSVYGGYKVKPNAGSSTAQQDDPLSNFNSIKGLIIKSADIVNAYYKEIDNLLKLSGEYVAQSDFGTFKEDTQNLVSATDTQLRQDLVDKQTIYDENGNIKKELLVNGNIYSGIIVYAKDGEAIVGIEIGQTTKDNGVEKFNKFARFTADRLAFYNAINPDEPVAYISDYKLYITHVDITGSLKEGGYVDTVDPDGGIVTKWVGGANNGE